MLVNSAGLSLGGQVWPPVGAFSRTNELQGIRIRLGPVAMPVPERLPVPAPTVRCGFGRR
ncbi:MAG: hypothetical protein K0S56_4208, partial [Microvirga sp.]|nr:hypothetical protein [Microvirga sp.]